MPSPHCCARVGIGIWVRVASRKCFAQSNSYASRWHAALPHPRPAGAAPRGNDRTRKGETTSLQRIHDMLLVWRGGSLQIGMQHLEDAHVLAFEHMREASRLSGVSICTWRLRIAHSGPDVRHWSWCVREKLAPTVKRDVIYRKKRCRSTWRKFTISPRCCSGCAKVLFFLTSIRVEECTASNPMCQTRCRGALFLVAWQVPQVHLAASLTASREATHPLRYNDAHVGPGWMWA